MDCCARGTRKDQNWDLGNPSVFGNTLSLFMTCTDVNEKHHDKYSIIN